MSAAWPGDSATVENWVRAVLRHSASVDEIAVQGLDGVRVTADLDGLDLRELTVDATRADLRITPNRDAAPGARPGDAVQPDELAREVGIARTVRFTALPMRIQKTPVTIDIRVEDLPLAWITYAEPTEPGLPESRYALARDDERDGLRGTFRFAIAADDIGPLATMVMRPLLREGRVRLGRVRIAVDGAGDDIRISASAGLRWKLLFASARAEATVSVTHDGVVTVKALTLGSHNPAVKVALLFARRHVREVVGRTFDAGEMFNDEGSGIRLHDIRVGTGHELSVAGRFS
ncbi:hypothetical protein KEC56_01555 [Microbacterium sp. YMB-B2]|uniref:Uncharacterized protein n=1 Tax=Microbacterium tenebrionis TaxID=2830665 RepID=A0A9X1LM78_9MICO|nr:hypothetical protein [Microbacterium tenebrionis]MCC2028223.1 hypothetical protein [Microbacterium tenebrionis]